MDCQLFERQVQRELDGLLLPREREDMLKHAAKCPPCAALLKDMTALEELLSTRLSAVEVPVNFAEAVMAALPPLPAKEVRSLKKARPLWQRWGTVAAAAALFLAVGVYGLWPSLGGNDPGVTPPPAPQVAVTDPLPDPDPTPTPRQTIPKPLPVGPVVPALIDTPAQPVESDPAINDDPANPDGEETPQPEENPLTQPEVPVIGQLPREAYIGSVDLPIPAYNPPQSDGMFTLTLLAVYEDCDAVLPSLNAEGLVEFYIKYKGQNHLWTQSLDAEEAPQYKGPVQSLPSLWQITGSVDESQSAGFSYISSGSPDGRFTAFNRGGEQQGLWLYESMVEPVDVTPVSAEGAEIITETGLEISGAAAGGKVLCWSPDSNKLIFTNASGSLFVYYLAEELLLPIYDGIVSCASWAEDCSTVIFAGKAVKGERSAIYAIMLP